MTGLTLVQFGINIKFVIPMPVNCFYFVVFLSFASFNIVAQSSNSIDSYFQEIRKGKQKEPPFSINDSNSDALISSLLPYLKDSSEAVRKQDILILKNIGLASKQPLIRRKVTFHLVLSSGGRYQQPVAIAALKKFKKEDFDKSSVDSLLSFLNQKHSQKNELIRLIGFVGGLEAVESIRQFSDPKNTQSVRWSSLLAMSRLGDVDATNSVLQRSKKLKVSDEVVNQLFPDLVYTHQKQIFDYLVEVLMSDENNCSSADNDNPTSILCGYRVMEQLAPAVKGYPLTLDSSGDVKTNDYKKSLAQVRQWFQENKDIYIIDNSAF